MLEAAVRMPIIESLILSSPEPLPARKIAEVIDDIKPSEIDNIVEDLNLKYRDNDISFRIRKIAGGYQVYIIEDYARYVEDLLTRRRSVRMTRAALETMAIIAYRQPVTKTDIEMIRGVASDSVIHTLLERKLITMAGRADSIGRPLLYKTTDEFLKFFNLNSLNDLPRMEEIEELLAASEPSLQPTLPLNGETADGKEKSAEDKDKQSTESQPENMVPLGPFARPVPSVKTDSFFNINDMKEHKQVEEKPVDEETSSEELKTNASPGFDEEDDFDEFEDVNDIEDELDETAEIKEEVESIEE